ncbi:hypothetical protein [Smaragdicoccus niigatensis]|uniref:hypothetical protein n=1 Tax=Smaragdicoccus niigatensis TaxID=359359 RepID=UPI000362C44B|nr:hypothetical protein [Smaragdicoccus niigatensis]
MKLNIFVGWLGYVLVLASAFCVPAGVVAAATGHLGWAAVAFLIVGIAAIVGIPTVAETIHYDHKMHRDIPHPF